MIKQYPKPSEFDGHKFAVRYGLDGLYDFWADQTTLYLRDGLILPDDPPIFEPPDPPTPTEKELLELRLVKIEADIVSLQVSI